MSVEALGAFEEAIARWDGRRGNELLWQRQASLWTGGSESLRLGWLEPDRLTSLDALESFAMEIREEQIRWVVLLGMGGSSLGADLLVEACSPSRGPTLLVLDSTDPDEIRRVEARIELERTLFVVASKSGTTEETVSLESYFFDLLGKRTPSSDAASHFVAITDPSTPLLTRAKERGYRGIFVGAEDVGGRYSVLSVFGLVPAAALGCDCRSLLASARAVQSEIGADRSAAESPGIGLGLLLGTLAARGHDKLTLGLPDSLEALGWWLEQLIAESTGKDEKGILPVVGEPRREVSSYATDRVLVDWRGEDPSAEVVSGAPRISLAAPGVENLGAELYRWQLATAVAGSVLALNPFDQPDVDASKVATQQLVGDRKTVAPEPRVVEVLADENGRWFGGSALAGARDRSEVVRSWLHRLAPGGFFATLAYLPRQPAFEDLLVQLRTAVHEGTGVVATLGFGPRYLHSTGQFHKGGPNYGTFLILTREERETLPIPGRALSFGQLEDAQARGDVQVLHQRGRNVLQVHLLGRVEEALESLVHTVELALREMEPNFPLGRELPS